MLRCEVPAFNRLFKTDVFARIRARCKDLRVVYVISPIKKMSSDISAVQKTDFVPADDTVLIHKYNLPATVQDLSTLYLFESILTLALWHDFVTADEVDYLIPFISSGYTLSVLNDISEIKNQLSTLNETLAPRTTLVGYRITMADVFVLSGLKRNPLITVEIQRNYPHVNRWAEWIQGLLGVDYERIKRQHEKSGAEQEKSLARLTSSKELIQAVKDSDYSKVKDLLEKHRANIESKDYTEVSVKRGTAYDRPLIEPIPGKKSKEAKKLPVEQTPLHIACDRNDFPMIKLLVEHGAKVNSEDRDGMTPIYYSILRKSIEACDYLLEKGASLEHRECQYRTPLYWTASLGELDMLEYLIKKGADVNAASKLGRTALSKACWNGQVHIVERMLKCKNADEIGRTPLHNASWGREGGREGVKTSINGRDSPECVKILIDNGANIMARDKKGNTSIHSASNTNAPESLELMLSSGGNVNCLNEFGSTPLHKSCKYGTVDCAKILLRHGSSFDFLLCRNHHQKPQKGVKLEVKDKRGFEAVDYLLVNGRKEALKYFLHQTEFVHLKLYIQNRLFSLRAVHLCIDNDSDKCLGALLKHFGTELDSLIPGGWESLVRRCLLLGSEKCLHKILKRKQVRFGTVEMELAVYFAESETVFHIIKEYYKKTPMEERKLSERVVKACIFVKRLDYLQFLTDITRMCSEEHEEKVALVEIRDWTKAEIQQIYNLDYLKNRKTYRRVPFAEIYPQFNDNNMLQYAIEVEDEKIAAIVMKTDVNLWTKRSSDSATSLILATKVLPALLSFSAMGKRSENTRNRKDCMEWLKM